MYLFCTFSSGDDSTGSSQTSNDVFEEGDKTVLLKTPKKNLAKRVSPRKPLKPVKSVKSLWSKLQRRYSAHENDAKEKGKAVWKRDPRHKLVIDCCFTSKKKRRCSNLEIDCNDIKKKACFARAQSFNFQVANLAGGRFLTMGARQTSIWELRLSKSRRNALPVELSRRLCGAMRKMERICVMPVESGTKSTGSVASVAGILPRRRRKLCPAVQAAAIPTKSPLVAKGTHLVVVSNSFLKKELFGFIPVTVAVFECFSKRFAWLWNIKTTCAWQWKYVRSDCSRCPQQWVLC